MLWIKEYFQVIPTFEIEALGLSAPLLERNHRHVKRG